MSKLQKVLRTAVLSLVVFSSLAVVSDTYAYWAAGVSTATDTQTALVSVGTWQTTVDQWDPAGTYLIGDRVINNGSIYEAKKDNPVKEPGVDGGWKGEWTLIGPA